MKFLYYNPIEVPQRIHIKSSAFNIEMIYEPYNAGRRPADFEELFNLASLDCFDEVSVYLTQHDQAYYKTSKKAIEGYIITGWVNLKDYKKGGGYLNDTVTLKRIPEGTDNG